MNKKTIFNLLALLLFIAFFSLEVNLAWPIISLIFWLIFISKFSQRLMPIMIFLSSFILSIFWPMSVLLSFMICLILYGLAYFLNKSVAQTSLVALLVSWLIVPVIYWQFSLNISWILLGQFLLSLVIFILIKKSSVLKLGNKSISFS